MGRRTHTCRAMVVTALAALITVLAMGDTAMAVHESTNTLVFEAVEAQVSPVAAGDGVIEYRGGDVMDSRWAVQLRFRGLEPGDDLRGRPPRPIWGDGHLGGGHLLDALHAGRVADG